MKEHSAFYNPVSQGRVLLVMVLILAGIIWFFTGCSKKAYFQQSSVVPAARGYVKVDKNRNNNYKIDVQLSNLAEVERLQDAKKTYVIWMVTDSKEIKNIGQIKSGSNMFSNKLKASFSTASSTRPTKVFITSEDDGGTQTPGDLVIMTTGDF